MRIRCMKRTVLSLAVLTAIHTGAAYANPNGAQVVNGQVSINQVSGMTTITNSPGAIINWQNFSIAQGEVTKFIQQSSQSAVLNRVIGTNASQIMGQLISNGHVFLINPNGILFGAGSLIDTQGFMASTLSISDQDFQSGNYHFIAGSGAGNIVNEGIIRTGIDGNIVLIAPDIENNGIIQTDGGKIVLAAGQELTLTSLDDPSIRFQVQSPDNEVLNLGQVLTEGGAINLFAGTITHSGELNANSMTMDAQGNIILSAQENITLTDTSITTANNEAGSAGSISIENQDGLIASTGTVQANGKQGGSVTITGDWAGLGGTIEANGTEQGGQINIDVEGLSLADHITATSTQGTGGDINIHSATSVWESNTSHVDASGQDGGSISLIAGQQIASSGHYTAKGETGAGGQIDITAPATKFLSAQINADGATSGGQIRLGGEYQGGKDLATDELPNAQILAASSGTTISAKSTTDTGDGGSVIIWADQKAEVYADVQTQQGINNTQNPGFIEISSGDTLVYGGSANAGIDGTVLFDPKNITIADATTSGGVSQYNLVLGYGYADIPGFSSTSHLEQDDHFGSAISLDGTRLVVAAYGDDGLSDGESEAGAIYLFTFSDLAFSSPSLEGTIGHGYTGGKNLDLSGVLEADDWMGDAVSLDGTRLAVGVEWDDGLNNGAYKSGAVYLFSFDDAEFSNPLHAATIGYGYTGGKNLDLSGSLEASDFFGKSVSLQGTRLVIGAYGDDGAGNSLSDSGAVYLVEFTGLNFSNPTLNSTIGSGYTTGKDFNLTALDGADEFGWSVSLDGTGLAIGAPNDDGGTSALANSGAVYLFTFADLAFNSPSHVATIGENYVGTNDFDVTTLFSGDNFGTSVSLDGTRLAVGAGWGGDGFGDVVSNSGEVYLFTFDDLNYTNPSHISTLGAAYTGVNDLNLTGVLGVDDHFGRALSLDGNRLVVGAESGDGSTGSFSSSSGEVYLITFADASFSSPVLSGTIGAGYTGGNNLDLSDQNVLDSNDTFSTISLDGTRLAVGAPQDDGVNDSLTNSGAVYLFEFADLSFNAPSLSAIIGAGYTGGNNLDLSSSLDANDDFGWYLSLDGARLAVGATYDDGANNTVADSGAVYLFEFADLSFNTPSLNAIIGSGYTGGNNVDLSGMLDAYDNLGNVSLDGTRLAIGSSSDDGANNTVADSGAVYLFEFADLSFNTPSLNAIIGAGYTGGNNFDLSGLLEVGDGFAPVSLDGARLAIGSYWDDGANNTVTDSGAVYLFEFVDLSFNTPSLSAIIGADYTGGNNLDLSGMLGTGDAFSELSLDGTRLAVTAYLDDGANNTVTDSGAAYLFEFADLSFNTPTLSAIIGAGYTGGNNVDMSSELDAGDSFGYFPSLDGSRIALSSGLDDGAGNSSTDTGAVYFFNLNLDAAPVADGMFSTNQSGDVTITPTSIIDILNTGSNVILQANNDIFLNSDVIVSAGGFGGDFELLAGRSIFLNANITTDGGSFTALANLGTSDGVVMSERGTGAGEVTVAAGKTINTGTGAISLSGQNVNVNGNLAASGITLAVNQAEGSITQAVGSLISNSYRVGNTSIGNPVRFTTDNLSLSGGVETNNSGSLDDILIIEQFSAGRNIELAGTSNTAGTLSITQSDLSAFSAGIILQDMLIGSATAGTVNIAGNYRAPGDIDTVLMGSSITQSNGTTISGGIEAIATSGSVILDSVSNLIERFTGSAIDNIDVTTNVTWLGLKRGLFYDEVITAGNNLTITNAGGEIVVNSGVAITAGGNAMLTAATDITFNAGYSNVSIIGNPDVFLNVGGDLKFLSANGSSAFVSPVSASTTNLTFNNTTGQVLFNGVQTGTTISGTSGFYYGGAQANPASIGNGLVVIGGDPSNFPAPVVVTPPPVVVTPPPVVATPPPEVVTPPPSVPTTFDEFVAEMSVTQTNDVLVLTDQTVLTDSIEGFVGSTAPSGDAADVEPVENAIDSEGPQAVVSEEGEEQAEQTLASVLFGDGPVEEIAGAMQQCQ